MPQKPVTPVSSRDVTTHVECVVAAVLASGVMASSRSVQNTQSAIQNYREMLAAVRILSGSFVNP